MLIAFEGIDGVGKTTTAARVSEALRNAGVVANFRSKKAPSVTDPYVADVIISLRDLIWPNDDGAQHPKLGERYWLHMVAAWFSLLRSAFSADSALAEIDIYDHWYYRFIAKYQVKGYDSDWLFSLFSAAPAPSLVILLDGDPECCWGRRTFKPQEMGGMDGYCLLGRDSYVSYQREVRARLLTLSEHLGWSVIPCAHAQSAEALTEAALSYISTPLSRCGTAA